MEYIYIIQLKGCKSFKVGRTDQPPKTLKKYGKHTLYMFTAVSNAGSATNELLRLLNEKFEPIWERQYEDKYNLDGDGTHSLCFKGEYPSILETFLSVIMKYPPTL